MLGSREEWPADLVAAAGATLLVAALSLGPARGTPLRAPVALPYLLVVPGYALVSALFPQRAPVSGRRASAAGATLSLGARLALGLGGSVAVVAAVGLLLEASGVGVRSTALVAGVCLGTLVLLGVAALRRARTPVTRYDPALPGRAALRAWLADGPTDAVLTALVLASVLLAAGAVYADATAPTDDPDRVGLFTPSPSGPVAEYPDTVAAGTETAFLVAVTNPRAEATTYGVVTVVQTVADGRVVDAERLDAGSLTVPAGETRHLAQRVAPTGSGERRLAFLVYRGPVPPDPSLDGADAEVHVWVTVTESTAS